MYKAKIAKIAFDTRALADLESAVEKVLSPYRMAHTRGVAKMAERLARLYLPREASLLRAAALLHDITKEMPREEHLDILRAAKRPLRRDERENPKVWHAITAPIVIKEHYPAFAVPALLSAVRWHTTAHARMTVREAILYLADYIEEGRTFSDCVTLRHFFFDAEPEKMPVSARRAHLAKTLEKALEMTLADIGREGKEPVRETVAAYTAFRAANAHKRRKNMVETLENWAELPSLADADAAEVARAAKFVLDMKKAGDIALIPVKGHSDITDYLVLANAISAPHIQSLADELIFRMGERGVKALYTDGGNRRSWVVVDFGTVMVHIFDRETRGFYHLDKLYKDAARSDEGETL